MRKYGNHRTGYVFISVEINIAKNYISIYFTIQYNLFYTTYFAIKIKMGKNANPFINSPEKTSLKISILKDVLHFCQTSRSTTATQ